MQTMNALKCTVCGKEEAVVHVTYKDERSDLACHPCNKLINRQGIARRAFIEYDHDGRFIM